MFFAWFMSISVILITLATVRCYWKRHLQNKAWRAASANRLQLTPEQWEAAQADRQAVMHRRAVMGAAGVAVGTAAAYKVGRDIAGATRTPKVN